MKNTSEKTANLVAFEKNRHYFCSFAFGWATGETRDEAIKKLVKGFHNEVKSGIPAAHKNGSPGVYVWTCEVLVSSDTDYGINFYKPENVPIQKGQNHFITYLTRKEMAYHNEAQGK